MTEPAARPPWRVPRSTLDELFAPSLPAPDTDKVIGTVVSIEIDTCTVLVLDEEISGVVIQQHVPNVGDVVEIERRGDLWVIVDFLVDTFIEGGNADAWHVVDDSDPALPDPVEIQVSGSMRDSDDWSDFWGGGRWTTEWDQSAALLTQVSDGGASLLSNEVFDVEPGQDITLSADFTVQQGAPTVRVRLFLATVESSGVQPFDPDTAFFESADLTYTLGETTRGEHTFTVPETITTTNNQNEGRPVIGRIDIVVDQTGATDGIVRVEQITALRQSNTFPTGSIWFNPTVVEEPPTIGGDDTLTYADIPSGIVDTDLAGLPRVQISAPGMPGMLMVWWTGYIWARTTGSPYPQISARDANGSTTGLFSSIRASVSAGSSLGLFPFTLVGSQPMEADQSVDLTLTGRYSTAVVPSTLSRVEWAQVHTLFIPNAIRPGTEFIPARRYWDGNSWRPYGTEATDHVIATVTPPAKVSSSTGVGRSPINLSAGETVTITAEVTGGAGTPTGTVTFYRGTTPTGPWTLLGSKSLSNGSTSTTWNASEGTWYFRGVYGGSSTYNGSEDVTNNATNVAGTKVEKVKTVTASWVQAYNGSDNQISGSSDDSAVHQGYYSSTHGNRKSLIRFAPNLPADAEVTKVQLICSNWAHWYYNAGGTLRVGWHSRTSKPSTWGVGSGATAQSSHSVDTGSWTINISSWAKTEVVKSAFAGITIGPGSGNSYTYYGYAGSGASPWKLKITYLTAT